MKIVKGHEESRPYITPKPLACPLCCIQSSFAVRDQEELLGHMKIFLAEKEFEGGRGGMEVTDAMRLTVAAH